MSDAAARERALAELLSEWEACAEVGWSRFLTIEEARLVLPALAACEERERQLREALRRIRQLSDRSMPTRQITMAITAIVDAALAARSAADKHPDKDPKPTGSI